MLSLNDVYPRTERDVSLNRRVKVEVELPAFVVECLQHRLAEANGAGGDVRLDLNDIIEWYLVSPITVADVPELEASIPGLADALGAWLVSTTYDFS
jgi:hypothetical protein